MQSCQRDGITTTEPESPLKTVNMDNVDCPICKNTGLIIRIDEDGFPRGRQCECMKKRVSLRNIEDSGLRDLVKRYSFDNYQTPGEAQKKIKQKAEMFVKSDAPFFIISGLTGSGKTHICTAICKALIEDNWKTKYMVWRTDAAHLKSIVNEGPAYEKEINRLRDVPVLYIDDLFKGGANGADIKLAFELLNYRYNQTQTRTIISTELDFKALRKIDDALASRIYKRSAGYCRRSPDRNYRIDPPCDI